MFKLYVLATLLLLTIGVQAQKCNLSIHGQVVDVSTGLSIEGATVILVYQHLGATTDADGHYTIDGICHDTATVECSFVGCKHRFTLLDLKNSKSELNFKLSEETTHLHEVSVFASKVPLSTSVPRQFVDTLILANRRSVNLTETLKSISGITSLNTGSSIAKPMIHGLTGDRIIILNNGIIQEGNQWGDEHAPEIDPFLATSISVIKGAEAVRYGSNAMGGVILVEAEKLNDLNALKADVYSGYSLNGNGLYGSAQLSTPIIKKWGLKGRIQGTYKYAGNLNTPSYFLRNTGLREYNFSWTLQAKPLGWDTEVFYSQFNNWLGILRDAHIGNVTDLEAAIDRGKPLTDPGFTYHLERPAQHVEHELTKFKTEKTFRKIGTAYFSLARQFNRRGEFDAHIPFSSDREISGLPEIRFQLVSWQVDGGLEHKLGRHVSGKVGFQYINQNNNTNGTLIPDYTTEIQSVYLTEQWRKYPFPLKFEAGLRIDKKTISTFYRKFPFQLNRSFLNTSYNIGTIYQVNPHVTLRAGYNVAWRAPNVSELFSEGLHHGTASYQIGDPNIQAEIGHNFSVSSELNYEDLLSLNCQVYLNKMNGFIYQEPVYPPTLTIRGAFPTFKYKQTDAMLSGLDFDMKYKLAPAIWFNLRGSTLFAHNQVQKDWIIFMPSDRVSTGLTIRHKNIGKLMNNTLTLDVAHVFQQNRTPDNISDYAPPPKPYTLLNLDFNTSIDIGSQQLNIGFSVNNLLNTAYREYMNRFRYFSDEMGTQAAIHFHLPISKKSKT